MPELPEVEVSRLGISPHVEGQKITKVGVYQKQLRWPVSEQVQHLAGERVTKVTRRAKYLLMHCQSGTVVLHLGMSGHLRVVDKSVPLKKHDHIEFEFESGQCLRLNDARRFGACLFQAPDESLTIFEKLGPEPLTDEFDAKWLYEKSRNKKQPVKQFIMDNHVVVGVGNIYANESLFKAGIHPKRAASQVSLKRYQSLVPIIKATLQAAIEQGGTTLKDFSQSDGKPGYFAQQLNVYGRKGQPCVTCKSELQEIRLGGRSTVYCKECQR